MALLHVVSRTRNQCSNTIESTSQLTQHKYPPKVVVTCVDVFAAKGNPLRRLRNTKRTALSMRLAKNRRYETKGKDLIVGISFGDIFPIEKTTKPAS